VLSLSTLYPNAARPRFGVFVARSLEALAERGDWDVTVINPVGVPPLALGRYRALGAAAVDGLEGGVHVHRPRFTLLPGIGGRLNPAMIVRSALPLARRLHAEAAFDVVAAQFLYPDGPAAARIARELGLPLSLKARGADVHLWGGKGYARRAMLRAAEQAAGVLAVSEALAGDMAALGFPREKIAVHYTGVDRAVFRPRDRTECRRELGLPEEAPLLATVGALIPRKGQALVIEALAEVPEAHLVIVGDGPERAMLEQLSRRLEAAERVHFAGSVDHAYLATALAAADAMVLPSASEGLANAWVEALACGTPLVISKAGGAREVVTGPEAGRIVAREPAAIAAAVRELIAQPPAREAVVRCAERFSWEAHAAALATHYEQML
jgi:glycosyltransferase involved in cell wall biosynthesis